MKYQVVITTICLETTNSVNVPLYDHFGYHLLSKDKLDRIVDIWFMFRGSKEKN
ncbi:hypothetical protein ACFLUJ_03015 [Chloroflexota bacterium]